MDAKTEQKTVLIVEDEKNIVDILRFNLQREGYRTVEAYDGADGLAKARSENPDIILLDVLMPGENGMAAAREIREYDSNVKIIFLTSSTEFAVESYAVDAWYYQLKPIRREDFFRLMDSACAACTREQKHSLILRSKGGIVRLELEELVYCEVMGRTLTFHLNNGVVLESMGRLDDLCDQLVEYPNFLRPHRSFLINMEYIANIAARSITMQDGAVVPLPHGKYSETKERYLSYIFDRKQVVM